MDRDNTRAEERIRLLAKNTDALIVKLDTLVNRIYTAKVNENRDLVEYYERQFAEASVEFMNGVETIQAEWYVLKGIQRPPPEQERLEPDMLYEIHRTVVSIVQSASRLAPQTAMDVNMMELVGEAPGSRKATPPESEGTDVTADSPRVQTIRKKDKEGFDVTG